MGINYTTQETQQISQLQSYIEEYCRTHGIDPQTYVQHLDERQTLDSAIFKDPAFQAYWQLTYLQLMEICSPGSTQTQSGEIMSFDEAYAQASDSMNDFIKDLVMDNPDFVAFASLRDHNSATNPQDFYRLIVELQPEEKELKFVDEQARDLGRQFGMNGMYQRMIDTEEGMRSSELAILNEIDEIDRQIMDLTDALNSGELRPEEYKAKIDQMSGTKGFLYALLQKTESALSQMIEMFSNMIKAKNDHQMSIINNQRGA